MWFVSSTQLEKEQKELKEKILYTYNVLSNDDFLRILQTHWERVGLCIYIKCGSLTDNLMSMTQ